MLIVCVSKALEGSCREIHKRGALTSRAYPTGVLFPCDSCSKFERLGGVAAIPVPAENPDHQIDPVSPIANHSCRRDEG